MKNMKRIIIIAGFIILNLQFSTLNSQNVIHPKISCPNGFWVNSYNGVLFCQRADLSIPTRNMPLEVVFYYNSSSNRANFGYGWGWSLGYEYQYFESPHGVTILTGDGQSDFYAADSYNTFNAPVGIFNTLTSIASGGYRLTTKEGTEYIFSDVTTRKVTQIKDRNNNVLNFLYSSGHLTAINDGNGRGIILNWTDNMLTSITTTFDNRQWHYSYDFFGNLESVTNPMGGSIHYGHDSFNRLGRFTDEAGYSTLFTYNEDSQIHRVSVCENLQSHHYIYDKSIRYDQISRQTIIIDYMDGTLSLTDSLSPDEALGHNQFTTYRWDEEGRVIEKVGNCCGYSTKLAYDNNNNVIRSEDANGNVTTYTYDANGNMLSLTDPLNNTETYTYTTDGYNNIATYTDKLHHQYTFSYDSHGNLISISGPMGSNTHFSYNSHGQVVTATDALNHTTTFTYDSQGNLTTTTDPLNHSVTTNHNSYGNITSIISPSGAVRRFNYDQLQRITAITDPLNNTTSLTYDARSNIVTVIDPMQHRITSHYDAMNRTTRITDARNGTTSYTYNAKGSTTQIENAQHHTVHLQYNDRNQVTLATDAMGDSTQYSYDAAGNIVGVALPNGEEISYTYDALSRPIQMSDQYGVIQTTIYDASDNPIAVVDAKGDTTHSTYDALGRLTQITDPLGNSEHFTYDLSGNMLTHTDANGNTTTYTYDAVGQLLTETDALNNVTTYTYTADSKLASVTDALNQQTYYQYDAAGQLSTITFANGKTQQFWYDATGNLIRQKDEAGNLTLMTYDANGNLLSRTYPDGSSDRYTYDLLGNVLTANNPNANITFTYDANGQVLSEQTLSTFNSLLSTLNYTYDTRQGKINITYPSGRQVTEQYDLRNRLSQIVSDGDTIATFTYLPTDYIASRTYGNGDRTTFSYDAANRLTNISSLNSQFSILNYSYSYDPAGNILSRIDALRPNHSETYSYDALHRLSTFRRGSANNSGVIPNPLRQVQFTLDALGNRTNVTANGTTTSYAHNNTNGYTNVGGQSIQYNGNGNLTNDGRHTYQYNYNNRMVGVDNGHTARYLYDALNRRIRKVTPSETTQYYYRGVQCIEEQCANVPSGQELISYIYGNGIDDILSMRRNGQDYFYHKNHLGSVMAITNSTGALVETYDYDPYGTPTIYTATGSVIQTSSIGNTILFTGREYDYETGQYYYRARTMHPTHGRFMQHDPLMYVDGMNSYEFLINNPTFYIDMSGEIPTNGAAARMATAVYGQNPSVLEGTGWNIDHRFDSNLILNDNKSGFKSNVFSRINENGQLEFAYVTQGTDNILGNDMINNIQQGLGLYSTQYDLSIYNAKILDRLVGDCELTHVGHSLGGGMAIANAYATGRQAIVFNPSSISNGTIKRFHLNEKPNIKTNITRFEILHMLRYHPLNFFLHPRGKIEIRNPNFKSLYSLLGPIGWHMDLSNWY